MRASSNARTKSARGPTGLGEHIRPPALGGGAQQHGRHKYTKRCQGVEGQTTQIQDRQKIQNRANNSTSSYPQTSISDRSCLEGSRDKGDDRLCRGGPITRVAQGTPSGQLHIRNYDIPRHCAHVGGGVCICHACLTTNSAHVLEFVYHSV